MLYNRFVNRLQFKFERNATMKLIRTYELNFKLNDELVFEGVANMFDTSIGLMYNIEGVVS